jgi:ATP-dependent Clp protease ATP-binding subunit ClpA
MFERFSKGARQVVVLGVQRAADRGAKARPEDLLAALAEVDDGVGARVLASFGVTAATLAAAVTGGTRRAGLTDEEIAALRAVGIDADEVFRRIADAFGPAALEEEPAPPPRRRGMVGGPLEPAARKAIELSLRETLALGHRRISTGHILLGVLRTGVSGPMSTVLAEHGVTYDDARPRVRAELREAA